MTDATKHTVYWESVAATDATATIAELTRLFAEAETLLGGWPTAQQGTLLHHGDFHIRVEEGYGLNTVNPGSAEGGGMLDDASGEQKDLLLILLFMRANMPANQFLICDEEGEVLSPSSWTETGALLEKLGIELSDDVLDKALSLGLRPAPIEFGPSDDIEDAWF
ncbi:MULTISPECIES: hypothetical protein [Halomonas]|uniref:hypothetical protein n=1 Tax=Halomonas TaxID=2745 RepID=UPI003CF10322